MYYTRRRRRCRRRRRFTHVNGSLARLAAAHTTQYFCTTCEKYAHKLSAGFRGVALLFCLFEMTAQRPELVRNSRAPPRRRYDRIMMMMREACSGARVVLSCDRSLLLLGIVVCYYLPGHERVHEQRERTK